MSEKIIFQAPRFQVIAINETQWNRVTINKGAIVFPVWKNKLGLVLEKRWVNQQWIESLEIPRGGVEVNESLEQAALRECSEELCLDITKYEIKPLLDVEPDNGVLTNRSTIFLLNIFDAEYKIHQGEQDCIIDRQWLDFDEVIDKIKRNHIYDSYTLSAFGFYYLTQLNK